MKLKDALNQDIPEPKEVLPPDYQAELDRVSPFNKMFQEHFNEKPPF